LEPATTLNEQLDCAPPELSDILPSTPPVGVADESCSPETLGPTTGEGCTIICGIELVAAAELVEQLPVLPLTPD
jgi:hypothetical protein